MTINTATYLKENKGLINSVVNRFYQTTSKFSKEDLTQEANLAACRALQRFDPNKSKSKVSTYLYSAVYRSCRDFVRHNKFDLYVTSYQQTKDWKEEENRKSIESEPTTEDALSQERIDYGGRFGCTEGPMAVRADKETADGAPVMSVIPSGSPPVIDTLIKKEQISILIEEVDHLPERERDIVRARYFDGQKLSEIARNQGVTRQRIDQISQRAIVKLTEKVKDRLGDELLI